MKEVIKKAIENYLNGFLQGLINKYDPEIIKDEVLKQVVFNEEKGEYKPFHSALIPGELLRVQSFFRSFSTSLGQGVFQYIAHVVTKANPRWSDVKLNSKFIAYSLPNIQTTVDTFLEDILRKNRTSYPYPSFPKPDSSATKSIVVWIYRSGMKKQFIL